MERRFVTMATDDGGGAYAVAFVLDDHPPSDTVMVMLFKDLRFDAEAEAAAARALLEAEHAVLGPSAFGGHDTSLVTIRWSPAPAAPGAEPAAPHEPDDQSGAS